MMKKMDEQKLADRIAPIVEKKIEARMKHRIVQSIVDALDEQTYPPEEMIREEYVKEVHEAEKRVKRKECKSFKNSDELLGYLNKLRE